MSECFICSKHQDLAAVPGGEIMGDEHALVTHLPLEIPSNASERVYLGYLFVEVRRHVAEFGELHEDEASSIGRLASKASMALQRSEGAEHVYAAVIGHGMAHFHMHLIPRYPGAPREYWWLRVDEWPDAPSGDAAEIDALARRLRATAEQS